MTQNHICEQVLLARRAENISSHCRCLASPRRHAAAYRKQANLFSNRFGMVPLSIKSPLVFARYTRSDFPLDFMDYEDIFVLSNCRKIQVFDYLDNN